MLSKRYRLTKRGSFNYVYNKGQRVFVPELRLVYCKGKNTRIGFCVANKIGKAHTRNKIKRRMRAIVRYLLPHFLINAQLVFVANNGIETLGYEDLCSTVIATLIKAGFLSKTYKLGQATSRVVSV